MRPFSLVVGRLTRPGLIVHGGAGSYLAATPITQRVERGEAMVAAARAGMAAIAGGAGPAVLAAVGVLEADPRFNAGLGSRLQRDGRCRLSAALMDGDRTRLSAVYNVQGCQHPSRLAAALQSRGDRNLDGEGARALMAELGIPASDVRTDANLERWRALLHDGERADLDSAVGDAGAAALRALGVAGVGLPEDLRGDEDLPPEGQRHGTVGALALGADGGPWACTSTGGRGHEAPGRVSDSPTPAGNYACPQVAISATGIGEQILDLDVAGRIATRVIDGATLEQALRQTFEEVTRHGGQLGVIALSADGQVGYAHTTDACGVAWMDAAGIVHVDQHSRPPDAGKASPG